MEAITIVSVALIGLLLIGFFLGFARSWKKSLVRFGIIVGCVVCSILLTNVFSSLIMSRYVNGMVVNILGFSIDFEQLANEVLGDSSFVADLFGNGSVTTKVATAFMNVVVNLLVYIIIFIVLFFISLIVYSIVSLIVTIRKNNNPETKKPVKIWERFIGGGIGIFGILLMCLVLFTPVFGVMSVCGGFIEDDKKTASAFNQTTLISAGLYHEANKPVEKVESYIDKYTELKKDYDKSFAGIVFKYTGTDFFGRTAFKKLTVVQIEGLTFDFVPECVNGIKFYNQYKTTFVKNSFDIANKESVDNLENLYSLTKNSEVMRNYIVELVPKFSTKWRNNEKYFGMEYPIKGDLGNVSKGILNVFDTTSYTQLDQNIEIVFDVIEIGNENGAIRDYKDGVKFEKIITKNNTFVRDEIIAMSKSSKFRKEMPGMMTAMIELEYKKIVGDPTGKFESLVINPEDVDWNKEAEIMQFISNNMFKIYLEKQESDDPNILRNNLTEIGMSIDKARKSMIINKHFKVFMIDYIKSPSFNMKDSVKQYALDLIEDNWDDPTYKFEDSFSALEETANIAEGIKDMDFETMKTALTNIINNQNSKEALRKALENGVIDDLADGNNTKLGVMNELMIAFTQIESNKENTNEEINATIKAGNEISDLVDASGTQSKQFEFEGDTEEEKKQDAVEMMENIAGSKTVMETIKNDNSTTSQMVDGVVMDKETAAYGIENAKISTEDKLALKKFFNIA